MRSNVTLRFCVKRLFRLSTLLLQTFLSARVLLQSEAGSGLFGSIRKVSGVILFSLKTREQNNPSRWFRRMRHCQRCHLYDQKNRTCGNRLDPDRWHDEFGQDQRYGCLCYMPFKARFEKVNCWLWERTDPKMGWPDNLNYGHSESPSPEQER